MRGLNSLIVHALLLSVSTGARVAPPPPDRGSVACDVALAYAETVIAQARNRPIVFTTDEEPFTFPITGGDWWTVDDDPPRRAKAPPAALVKRLQHQGNRNAVAGCSSVRRLLDSRGIKYGSKAVGAVSSRQPSVLFKATIHTISVPVVSADGKKAVLASSGVAGPLAGGGFLQLLERQQDGRWRVIASAMLWVS